VPSNGKTRRKNSENDLPDTKTEAVYYAHFIIVKTAEGQPVNYAMLTKS
jgi:hypothetical protein